MSASSIVGHRFIYTYDNGWQYELYVKNASTIDYRIHSGMVGGRWVKDQMVDLTEIAPGVHKISWTEPTGTSVVVTFVPDAGTIHGTIFFPRWVHEHPERTVLFQNDHIDQMLAYRAAGPIYPLHVVVESARIQRIDVVGADDDTVISCAPAELPAGFLPRD